MFCFYVVNAKVADLLLVLNLTKLSDMDKLIKCFSAI